MTPSRISPWLLHALLPAALFLSACAVGPDYHRPSADVPAQFTPSDGWKPAAPDDAARRGSWWQRFDDPVLDGLEAQVEVSNQTLAADAAAYRQSLATVQIARAAYFPDVTASVSATRTGSAARNTVGTVTGGAVTTTGTTATGATTVESGRARVNNTFDAALQATWEIDLWGKIRRTVESDKAAAQASAADLANARLSLQGTLATDYFALRVLDEEMRLYDATIAAYQRTYALTKNQYAVGVAMKSDVLTAETQLESAQAAGADLAIQRAQYEHAIAVLIGKPPEGFSIAPVPFHPLLPPIPDGIPSDLLQRRPDIAAQERTVASANAQIGVAIAAFFPDLTLSGSVGYEGTKLEHWLAAPYRIWSVGPQLAATLFNGGALTGAVASARALYDEQVATYRQTVLAALQSVEDQLTALQVLEKEQGLQDAAASSAQKNVEITLNEYKAGTVDYTSVATAQTTALADERTQLTVTGNRLAASVALIEALGGGWDAGELDHLPALRYQLTDALRAAVSP